MKPPDGVLGGPGRDCAPGRRGLTAVADDTTGSKRGRRGPPPAASGDAAEEVTAGAALAGGERGQRWKPAGGEGRALRFIQVRLDDEERGHPRGAKLLEVRRQVGHAGVEEARAADVDVGGTRLF